MSQSLYYIPPRRLDVTVDIWAKYSDPVMFVLKRNGEVRVRFAPDVFLEDAAPVSEIEVALQ